MSDDLLFTNLLPQKQLCARNIVAEAEERGLGAGVDLSALKCFCCRVGNWIVWGALKVQCAAIGGDDVEEKRGDVLAVVLACGEILNIIHGLVVVAGRTWSGQSGSAQQGGGGGGRESHFD